MPGEPDRCEAILDHVLSGGEDPSMRVASAISRAMWASTRDENACLLPATTCATSICSELPPFFTGMRGQLRGLSVRALDTCWSNRLC